MAGSSVLAAVAVRSTNRSGWGRAGHRRTVLIGALAFAIVIGGGVAAWAEVSGTSAGYRIVTVTRADIADTLTVVGTLAPVNQAAAAFQVAGKVTSVTVTPGSQVTAGQTLGTLDTTALSETVASDGSALDAAEAKLAEDEANQSATGSSSNSSKSSSGATGSTATTTAPSSGSGSGGQGTANPTVTKDQNTLTQDEAALSKAQQQEAADLAQAQTDCTSANTSTPSGQAACESALQTLSADEQSVSTDQSTVSNDETALAQALAAESSGGSGTGGSTGNSGSAPHAVADEAAFTGNTGASGSPTGGNGSTSPSSSASGATSGNTDTPEQIASDQAAIDTAQADLTEAQQSLKEATLTSPISGTVVSVAISPGDTVSAGSSTQIITILGTNSYEVEATLDSSQIPSVKVGQPAEVEVDGVDGTTVGTVSQVGPVQSNSSGYSYPVIVALPAALSSAMHSGATANVTITTGTVSNVVAVPTSAVQTLGTRSYVLELSKGQLTRKAIKVGMVGDSYTQVDSGLSPGQSVVLVDYAQAVPSSNNNTNLGSVLGGAGGAGGFFGRFPDGGGAFPISNVGGGGGKGFPGG
jgi:HlyD family secretion protein